MKSTRSQCLSARVANSVLRAFERFVFHDEEERRVNSRDTIVISVLRWQRDWKK